jgi:hypothetical protein
VNVKISKVCVFILKHKDISLSVSHSLSLSLSLSFSFSLSLSHTHLLTLDSGLCMSRPGGEKPLCTAQIFTCLTWIRSKKTQSSCFVRNWCHCVLSLCSQMWCYVGQSVAALITPKFLNENFLLDVEILRNLSKHNFCSVLLKNLFNLVLKVWTNYIFLEKNY